MQTDTRNIKVILGQAYRNYARIMQTQIRRNSLNMKESDIVKKIVQAWDALSSNQKMGWKNNEIKETIPFTPLKLEADYGRMQKMNNSNNKSTDEKIKSNSKMSNQKLEKQEDMIIMNNMNENSSEMMNQKSKGIVKKDKKLNKSEQYMSFFKTFYPRVMMEHPNWNPNQATIIIKLLWRKRKTQLKKITTAKVLRQLKPISGRKAFMKSMSKQSVSKQQMISLWKRLPIESKKIWSEKGKNSAESSSLMNKTSMIKLSSPNEILNNMTAQSTAFSFMNQKM